MFRHVNNARAGIQVNVALRHEVHKGAQQGKTDKTPAYTLGLHTVARLHLVSSIRLLCVQQH